MWWLFLDKMMSYKDKYWLFLDEIRTTVDYFRPMTSYKQQPILILDVITFIDDKWLPYLDKITSNINS